MEYRVSNSQINELLDILMGNPSLVRGGAGRSKETIDRKWQDIADRLNAHGNGSTKSGRRWKRYWQDLKHKVKGRAIQRQVDATGGDPPTQVEVSDLDQKVLAILEEAGDVKHWMPLLIPMTSNSQQKTEIIEEVLESPSVEDEYTILFRNESPVPSTSGLHEETPAETTTGSETSTARPRKRFRPSMPRKSRKEGISTAWLMELEEKRVEAELKRAEAESKMADAAKMTAEAATVMADVQKMQAEATLRQNAILEQLLLHLVQK
ncbi:unnamed protein product [Callosobruchus maculatus]|uniref:Regulatory protein zeste n=1 Tax=Callosobruchus maculatus TaxID=64391 RepID=A0A653CFI7_CALMS|nr:unnamed protein product [Callosobruchus maculatus]